MKNGRIFTRCLAVLIMIMIGSPCLCKAHVFIVGGKDGWVVNPSEDYVHWAERNRFQVNDTLLFKYPKGNDSVLVVTRDNFASCNTKNPIMSLTDGESRFTFDRSGSFFFISGNPSCCNGGQKLLVQVLAVRSRAPSPNPTKQYPPPPPAPIVSTPPPPGKAQPPETSSGPSGPGSNVTAPAPAKCLATSIPNRLAVHLALGAATVMAMFIIVRV